MTKFYGKIGFGESAETAPGVWKDVITERSYFGDVIRNSRDLRDGEYLNKELAVENSISIVSDEWADQNYFAIRYIEWAGALWTVSNVRVESPRLLLRLGGVYNGPKAGAPDDSGGDSGE
jgi:hypothetical protein